jgi:hypothetical protein
MMTLPNLPHDLAHLAAPLPHPCLCVGACMCVRRLPLHRCTRTQKEGVWLRR